MLGVRKMLVLDLDFWTSPGFYQQLVGLCVPRTLTRIRVEKTVSARRHRCRNGAFPRIKILKRRSWEENSFDLLHLAPVIPLLHHWVSHEKNPKTTGREWE